MKIKKAAAIAEVVSAIAVVISLLYVGYEVRQNTAAVKSTAYQSIHDAEDRSWQSISADRELSAVWGFTEVLRDTSPHLSDPFNELLNSR